jgi:hypothetical protein
VIGRECRKHLVTVREWPSEECLGNEFQIIIDGSAEYGSGQSYRSFPVHSLSGNVRKVWEDGRQRSLTLVLMEVICDWELDQLVSTRCQLPGQSEQDGVKVRLAKIS